MNVRRVAGQEHAPLAIRLGLSRHVGESREVRDVVNAEIGFVDGDERRAKIFEARLVALHDVGLDEHDAHALCVPELADPVHAFVAATNSDRGLVLHLRFRDQVADGWVPTLERDSRFLANQTSTAVAADDIFRAERSVGQRDVDAVGVLREVHDVASAINRNAELRDPLRENAFDAFL